MKFKSEVQLEALNNATVDTDKFLVSDGDVVKYRTGAQLLSDIGSGVFVPYTGATSDVNLGEFGVQLGNLEFDLTPTNTPTTVGSMYWNDPDGTADLILKGGNVTLQIGQETVARVVNKTATNITLLEANYQAVRVTGAQGQRPKVDLAQADNDLDSASTLGLVTETILINQEGFITTSGQVREINTTGSLQGETWLDGDILYLSGTVAGRITNIKPIAPIHTVIIGFVEYAHAIHGKIFVKVNNGYELEELHNVSAIAPNNNEVLVYDTSSPLWMPKTIPNILGYTPADDSNVVHKTGDETITGTKTFSQIGFAPNIQSYADSGNSIESFNSAGGNSIYSENSGIGTGISSYNSGLGNSITSNTVDGNGIISNSIGAGLVFVGQNNNTTTLTINKEGDINANSFIKSGGTASQFLKANGTVDSTTYVPTSRTLTINGVTQDLSANRTFTVAGSMSIGGTITSATAGSVLFAGIGGVLQQDNSQFFWDDTNNRLGLGTTSPSAKLHVVGDGLFSMAVTTSDKYLSNIAAQANFRGNWGGSDYWGIGSTSVAHQLRLGMTNITGAYMTAPGDMTLLIDGAATFSSSVTATSFIGPLTGNATTATTLQTTRTFQIGNTGKTFNGSANVSWTLTEIGALTATYSGAQSGYLRLSNGLVLQWGLATIVGSTTLLVTLPLAATSFYNLQTSYYNNASAGWSCSGLFNSGSQILIRSTHATDTTSSKSIYYWAVTQI